MRSVEHVKRYTTIGTAHDQEQDLGIVSSGIVAELLGVPVADTGTTTFRPPYTPVSFAVLAGRDRVIFMIPCGAPHSRLARQIGGRVRGRRAVETAALLSARRRGHGRGGPPRMCRGPFRCRHSRRVDARSDRVAGLDAPRSWTCFTPT